MYYNIIIYKMNDHYKYFISGSTSVLLSKFITYPLDRIKLINQTHNKKINMKEIFNKDGIRGYFKNFHIIGLINFPKSGLNFTMLNYFKDTLKLNPFLAGSLAGSISGSLFFPFEIHNIKNSYSFYKNEQNCILCKTPVLKLYSLHLFGIQLYYGLNFGSYNYIKQQLKCYKMNETLETFLSGVIAEYITISVTYPIDTIRKRVIVNYDKFLFSNIYKGFGYMLIKSPISCGIFYTLSEFIYKLL